MTRIITGVTAAALLLPAIGAMAADKPMIYIAGDSTALSYSVAKYYPLTGWGQPLADCFTDDIVFENYSSGGRSAKLFVYDGQLDAILNVIQPGDHLIIQFGIYDGVGGMDNRYTSVDEYKTILKEKFIDGAEARGAIPVLMTPCARLSWDERNGVFKDSRQNYANATREVASETGCEFIDVNRIMTETFNTMDKDDVFSCYMNCEPLESAQSAASSEDPTLLKESGAKLVAKIIADAIPECVPELSVYLKKRVGFADIAGHWAEADIIAAQENGFVSGGGDGRFSPDSAVTRAEFLKMAMSAAKIPGHAFREGECLEAFQDDWYCNYLQSALDKGLIPYEMIGSYTSGATMDAHDPKGVKPSVTVSIVKYSCGFKGVLPITREEMAIVAMNCLSYAANAKGKELVKDAGSGGVHDSDISEAYLDVINDAYACGLVRGVEGSTFRPKDNLTRAQAVTIINRIAAIMKGSGEV